MEILAIGNTGMQLVNKFNKNFTESGGLGYIIQTTDAINTDAWWATKVLTFSTFSVVNDYDFSGVTVNLPADITIYFNGGIWSNGILVGNKTVISPGAKYAFDTMTFNGTWNVEYLFPQNFGVITNSSTINGSGQITAYDTTNDCSAVIQAAFDSGFNINFPPGLYYLSSGLTITKPINIKLSGGKDDIATVGYANAMDNINAIIYTDDIAIDLFTIQCPGFNFKGGIIDQSQVADMALENNVFVFDLAYNCSNFIIDTQILGNNGANGYCTNGVWFDNIKIAGSGYCTFGEVKGQFCYLKRGAYIPKVPLVVGVDPTIDAWVGGIKFNFNSWACEVIVELYGGFNYYIGGVHEARATYTITERYNHFPIIIGGAEAVEVNPILIDYRGMVTIGGTDYYSAYYLIYSPSDATYLSYNRLLQYSSKVFLGASILQFTDPAVGFYISTNAQTDYNNSVDSLAYYWASQKFHSLLHNKLKNIEDKGIVVTYAAFDSGGNPILTITPLNIHSFFKYGIVNGKRVDYTDANNCEDAYFEIYLPNLELVESEIFGLSMLINNTLTRFKSVELYANSISLVLDIVSKSCNSGYTVIANIPDTMVGTHADAKIVFRGLQNETTPIALIPAALNIEITDIFLCGFNDYSDYCEIHNPQSGTTANRPTIHAEGQQYFDTTLGIPIWWDGSNWIDSLANIV